MVIAVAGMDGALPSVLGGLIPGVIICLPTSTGYGAARGGETALHAALASCAPGLTVVNIDNGYGAACAAFRTVRALPHTRTMTSSREVPREMTRAPGTTSLPVLDMSQLDRGDAEAANFRTALRTATHDVGFFYLVGHGIPEDVTARAFAEATRFFALPLDDKRRVEMLRSPQFRGYTRTGGELTQGQVDWREQIDIGAERAPSDDPAAPVYMRLEGPNLWPEAQPDLRTVFTDWEHRCAAVARRLLRSCGAVPRQSVRRLRQRLRRPPLHPDQARPLPRPRRARAGRRRAQGSRRAHAADDRAGQGGPAGRHLERVG